MTAKDFPVGTRVSYGGISGIKGTVICNTLKYNTDHMVAVESDSACVSSRYISDLKILPTTKKVTVEITHTWNSNIDDSVIIEFYQKYTALNANLIKIVRSEEGE